MSHLADRPKRLIEVSLPLKAISAQSAREKSIRHGHISTLHIWWARRPLAAMRAAIFASLIPAPDTDEEREKLEGLIATIVDWDQVKDGNSPAIEKAKALIREAFPEGPPKLLDPFMGGGATGLEALRLGCETHAVELNPVAHLIELCTLVYPQKYGQPEKRIVQQGAMEVEMEVNPLAEDVRKWGEWVLERAQEEIGQLYENPVGDETIVGYLWARTVNCPNPACGAEMPLVRGWWVARKAKRKAAIKPLVNKERKEVSFEVVQGRAIDFDPSKGTTRRLSATCLFCEQSVDARYVQTEGQAGSMGQIPLAVILSSDEKSGKVYRSVTEADQRAFGAAIDALERLNNESKDSLSVMPDEPLPYLRSIFNVHVYGTRSWGQLFNPRQALALLTFSRQVRAAYDAMLTEGVDTERAKTVVTYLGLTVDRIATRLANQCIWDSTTEGLMQIFNQGQSLPMRWDYGEANPFSGSSGDWLVALDWVLRVIEHTAQTSGESAIVQQGTATRMSYPDGRFDAIITDPPYYDAVPYADLSDFFYVWLKRSVGFLYPDLFRTPLTPKSMEIVQLAERNVRYKHKDKAFYEQEMTRAFAEACRVLRADGICVVVFAHKSIAAWETILSSLLEADLVVTASWPLHTEMSTRLRAHESAALASSIFIVCRVRAAETEGYFDDVREELSTTIRERLDFFWEQGIRGADFFISAIGPAVYVFGRYSKVYRLDGSEVGVETILDLVQEMVSEYALDRILNGGAARVGGVDASTRYYILHRWAYGTGKIPFDDAMRLAMALGADVTALMEKRGILKQSGETVRLRGPRDRKGLQDLGLPSRDGMTASIIDVLHRAATLWESGDRDELAQFLTEGARAREDQVRLVAQTLINILPDDDSERRLLEGFLAGRDVLPEVARQERLL
jgi:putative DNA methylase